MSRLSTKPEPAPDVSFPLTSAPLARALAERDYSDPTPVQTAVLAPETEGRDLLVSAQTGSGKTVAYGIAFASPMPPALFDRRYFPQLVEGRGDVGARDLLTGARLVAGDPDELADIDRPQDMR